MSRKNKRSRSRAANFGRAAGRMFGTEDGLERSRAALDARDASDATIRAAAAVHVHQPGEDTKQALRQDIFRRTSSRVEYSSVLDPLDTGGAPPSTTLAATSGLARALGQPLGDVLGSAEEAARRVTRAMGLDVPPLPAQLKEAGVEQLVWTAADIHDRVLALPPAERVATARQIAARARAGEAWAIGDLEYVLDPRVPGQAPVVDALVRFFGLVAWAGGPLELGRPGASRAHDLGEAMTKGDKFWRLGDKDPLGRTSDPELVESLSYVSKEAPAFVVQHDWSAALAGADLGGELRLPAPFCMFEFRLSGLAVVAVSHQQESVKGGAVDMLLMVEHERGHWTCVGGWDMRPDWSWVYSTVGRPLARDFDRVAELLGRQVQAVVVALDAEVADAEAVAPPERLNRSRVKSGKAPLREHHLVRLAGRHRRVAEGGGELGPGGERRRPRMHFRRGHWRHYDEREEGQTFTCEHTWRKEDPLGRCYCEHCGAYRRWVRWQLVGDPALGWVDKTYRL